MKAVFYGCCSVLVVLMMMSSGAQAQVFLEEAASPAALTSEEAATHIPADVPETMDLSGFGAADPDYAQNQAMLTRGQYSDKSRMLTVYDSGNYLVAKLCQCVGLVYAPDGRLVKVHLGTSPLYSDTSCPIRYPQVSYIYAFGDFYADKGFSAGKLMFVQVDASDTHNFLYNPDRSLRAHWTGEACTNPDGSSCGSRRY